MNKLYEGASVISALLLVFTAACTLLFNIHKQEQKNKDRRHAEKKYQKKENLIREEFHRKKQKIEEEKNSLEKELELSKKLRDPLWHYYDHRTGEVIILPGKYGIDTPPPYPYTPGY